MVGTWIPILAPMRPMSVGVGSPWAAAGYSASGGDVVSGAGLDLADPDRIPGGIGDDLDVPNVLLVLVGIPQVMAGFGAGTGSCGADQSVVQTHELPVVHDVGQVRCVGGDHVDAPVRVPVGRGDRDAGVARGSACQLILSPWSRDDQRKGEGDRGEDRIGEEDPGDCRPGRLCGTARLTSERRPDRRHERARDRCAEGADQCVELVGGCGLVGATLAMMSIGSAAYPIAMPIDASVVHEMTMPAFRVRKPRSA